MPVSGGGGGGWEEEEEVLLGHAREQWGQLLQTAKDHQKLALRWMGTVSVPKYVDMIWCAFASKQNAAKY